MTKIRILQHIVFLGLFSSASLYAQGAEDNKKLSSKATITEQKTETEATESYAIELDMALNAIVGVLSKEHGSYILSFGAIDGDFSQWNLFVGYRKDISINAHLEAGLLEENTTVIQDGSVGEFSDISAQKKERFVTTSIFSTMDLRIEGAYLIFGAGLKYPFFSETKASASGVDTFTHTTSYRSNYDYVLLKIGGGYEL